MDPIVLQFQGFVTDLNTVEKRKIVALTEIARDALQKNPHVAPYLAQTVINRILQAPVEAKLPALYLLDSITKNVGDPYKSYFATNLPEAFGNAWITGAPGLHRPLEKLLNTWNGVFPSHVVEAIKTRKFHPPTSKAATAASRPKPMTQDPRLHSTTTAPPQQVSSMSMHAATIPPQHQGHGYPPIAQTQPSQPHAGALLPHLLSLIASSNAVVAQQQEQAVPPTRPALQEVQQKQDQKAVSILENPPSIEFKNEKIKENNPAAIERLLSATDKTKSLFLDRKFLRKQQESSASGSSQQWYIDVPTWLASASGETIEQTEKDRAHGSHLPNRTSKNATNHATGTAAGGTAATSAALGLSALAATSGDRSQPRPSVAVDDERTHCALSGERFEQFWDEEHQEWRYKDALRLTSEEAARYGLEEGALVLVSALGSGITRSVVMHGAQGEKGKREAEEVCDENKESKRIKTEI